MAWPEFGHVIYFLIWHNLFPFLVSGEGGEGLQDFIQIKGPHVPGFFFAYPLDLFQWFWEGTRVNPCPIMLRDFLIYIVVPETAVLLIAKELSVTRAHANNIQLESKEYSKAFYSETDDGRIDDITITNIQALVR